MFPFLFVALIVAAAEAGKIYYEGSQGSDVTICPDQTSKCSGASTCCQMGNGQWGCCQFAQATCCSDNLHCCPQGYSCNMLRGECVQAAYNNTIPWAKKEAALPTKPSPENLLCPDRSVCYGTYSACCRTRIGRYNCCNFPNNVCCSDGYHCCRRGYICDLVSFVCRPGSETSDEKEMTPVLGAASAQSMEWASIEQGN